RCRRRTTGRRESRPPCTRRCRPSGRSSPRRGRRGPCRTTWPRRRPCRRGERCRGTPSTRQAPRASRASTSTRPSRTWCSLAVWTRRPSSSTGTRRRRWRRSPATPRESRTRASTPPGSCCSRPRWTRPRACGRPRRRGTGAGTRLPTCWTTTTGRWWAPRCTPRETSWPRRRRTRAGRSTTSTGGDC
ncbi:unnamed protein product, partial [Ectocarpus fasciculatus]